MDTDREKDEAARQTNAACRIALTRSVVDAQVACNGAIAAIDQLVGHAARAHETTRERIAIALSILQGVRS